MKKIIVFVLFVVSITVNASPSLAGNKKYKCKPDWIRMPAVVKSLQINTSKDTWICFAEGEYFGRHKFQTKEGEEEIVFGFTAGKGGFSAQFVPGDIHIIRIEDDE